MAPKLSMWPICACGDWSPEWDRSRARWCCAACGGFQTKTTLDDAASTSVHGRVEPFLVLVCPDSGAISLHAVPPSRLRAMPELKAGAKWTMRISRIAGAVRLGMPKLSDEERKAQGKWGGSKGTVNG